MTSLLCLAVLKTDVLKSSTITASRPQPSTAHSGFAKDYRELPAKYRRKPLDQAEIDYIQVSFYVCCLDGSDELLAVWLGNCIQSGALCSSYRPCLTVSHCDSHCCQLWSHSKNTGNLFLMGRKSSKLTDLANLKNLMHFQTIDEVAFSLEIFADIGRMKRY